MKLSVDLWLLGEVFTPTAAPISAVRPASFPTMLPLTSAPSASADAMATRSPANAARYKRRATSSFSAPEPQRQGVSVSSTNGRRRGAKPAVGDSPSPSEQLLLTNFFSTNFSRIHSSFAALKGRRKNKTPLHSSVGSTS